MSLLKDMSEQTADARRTADALTDLSDGKKTARALMAEEGFHDPTAMGLIEINLGTALAGGMSEEHARAALREAIETQAPGSVLTPTGPVLHAVTDFYQTRAEANAAQGATQETQYYANLFGTEQY